MCWPATAFAAATGSSMTMWRFLKFWRRWLGNCCNCRRWWARRPAPCKPKTSCSPARLKLPPPATASLAHHQRCCKHLESWSVCLKPRPAFCCWVNRAPAKSCLHGRCICRASGATSRLSRSIAQPSRTRCLSLNCLAMSAVHLPGRNQRVLAGLNRPTGARFFLMKLARCLWPCRPSS